jgi:hypothetical protein
MAKDYRNIGLALANTKNRNAEAIEFFSKGLDVLQELEEKTGYHHPLNEAIQGDISQLQEDQEITNNNDKDLSYDNRYHDD